MPARRVPAARPSARSLADDIRRRTDDELVRLVLGRPDLARPAPADLTGLAARATTQASVQRCIEALDRGHVQVLEAAAAADDGADPGEIARLLGTDADVTPYVDRLRELALLWEASDGIRVARTVGDVLGAAPAGLGPSASELQGTAAAGLTDPAVIARRIAEAPAGARAVLDRLTWGPPVGTIDPAGPGADAVRWLLDVGLLARLSPDHPVFRTVGGDPGGTRVVLPRDVAVALRGGRIHRQTQLEAPVLQTVEVGEAAVDAAAGGEATDLLTLVEELGTRWGEHPPRVLRTGGLAVRDLRLVADALELSPERAAWLVELAYAAGLLGDDGQLSPTWAPTPDFDAWVGASAGAKWARLASAWLVSTRAAHLVGSRSPGAGGTSSATNALGPDVQWPAVRAIRAEVLGELTEPPPGAAPTADSVVEQLLWRRPLRNPRLLRETAEAVLREAEWLGVTGRGALGTGGRALLESPASPDVDALAAAMTSSLPQAVDHVLVQADLTAIAPGPLEGELLGLMRRAADIESRGAATVYRFTPGSVRRALDAGATADELLERLRAASRTGVPQPLDYLVRDVARRHGQTRVGSATSYLRSDDEAVLEAMLAERALGPLRLRRIAPTVLVSPAEPRAMLDLLRDKGFAPMREGSDGSVVVTTAGAHRAPRPRVSPAPRVSGVDEGVARELVVGLRSAQERADDLRAAQDPTRPRLLATDPSVTIAVLREAAADRHGVWIGYADQTGRTATHLFYPTRVEGGRAFGALADESGERSFSIHRVTGVAAS